MDIDYPHRATLSIPHDDLSRKSMLIRAPPKWCGARKNPAIGACIASSIIYCAIYAQACAWITHCGIVSPQRRLSGSASGTTKGIIEAAFRDDINTKPNREQATMSIIEVKVPQLSESVSEQLC